MCRVACSFWCWWWKIHDGIDSSKVEHCYFRDIQKQYGSVQYLVFCYWSWAKCKNPSGSQWEFWTQARARWEKLSKMRSWPEVNCLKNENKTFWYVPLMIDNYILYFRWFSECLIHSLVSAPYDLCMRSEYWKICLFSVNFSVGTQVPLRELIHCVSWNLMGRKKSIHRRNTWATF